ncbi:methyltransferase domain-containing protein [Savagea sp. SN6]|uniref:Methyltransferase domain-containing protein n=1 Tax=Savagea serpentis TaxID=2785297 RepID=A0A8J7GBT4_9BACL|nr:methyltransferase domain-containing protein [Savagea serpentis]MBF4500706.1 methyltransferase domain-containing protein [Savagea serpentis]
MMRSKKQQAASRIEQWGNCFRCPHCHTDLHFEQETFRCENGHTFDLAKQGYAYLFNGQPMNDYSKALFEARERIIVDLDLYAPVHEALASWLREIGQERGKLLDAGSGEGSQLYQVLQRVPNVQAIGIDLAKDGVQQAAKQYSDATWFVNDLANLAFQDETFDVILNMLSPANYDEFDRVLKAGGYLVKIIPNTYYLRELREAVYEASDERATYNNEKTRRLMEVRYDIVKEFQWTYSVTLTEQEWQALVQMTPLTWNVQQDIPYEPSITIDLVGLVVQK